MPTKPKTQPLMASAGAQLREPQLIHRFTVQGWGLFPHDLLRLQRCWPATVEASAEVCSTRYVRRQVELRGLDEPDRRLWERASWEVVMG